ncbi:MAG: hypothetical protein WAL47_02590, partial [Pyrinomonadaceae bacterium]
MSLSFVKISLSPWQPGSLFSKAWCANTQQIVAVTRCSLGSQLEPIFGSALRTDSNLLLLLIRQLTSRVAEPSPPDPNSGDRQKT